jgi:hypothetical protein
MKLEDQVCSLELAKRLKELGVKQEGCFWWLGKELAYSFDNGTHVIDGDNWTSQTKNYDDAYCAFTVAERGEMLPRGYVTGCTNLSDDKRWCCHWYLINHLGHADDRRRVEKAPYRFPIYGCSEADARAKMLIYLLENNLVMA